MVIAVKKRNFKKIHLQINKKGATKNDEQNESRSA